MECKIKHCSLEEIKSVLNKPCLFTLIENNIISVHYCCLSENQNCIRFLIAEAISESFANSDQGELFHWFPWRPGQTNLVKRKGS